MTALAALIFAAFTGLITICLLGYPTKRSFWQAVCFGLWKWARFWWSFAAGVDHGLQKFGETGAKIQVPEHLREPIQSEEAV